MELEQQLDEHSVGWALHLAAAAGDAAAVRELLQESPAAASIPTAPARKTPLHAAAAGAAPKYISSPGHEEAVGLLLAAAPETAVAVDALESTPLHLAAAAGMGQATQLLLKAAPSTLVARNYVGNCPINMAAARGHESLARLLLEATPEATAATAAFREDLLRSAASGGLASLVESALEGEPLSDAFAVVESLGAAARAGHEEVVRRLLLYAPAAALAADEFEGWTPLHNAVVAGQLGVVRLLLAAAPAAALEADWEGSCPLFYIPPRNTEAIVLLLLEAAPEVAAWANLEGCTPLHCAAQQASTPAVRLLLAAAPATAAAVDSKGRTPLNDAASRAGGLDGLPGASTAEVIALLLAAHPSAALVPDSWGDLPLHAAAKISHGDAIQALLAAAPAAAGVRNAAGWLPLDLALAATASRRCRSCRDGAGWPQQYVTARGRVFGERDPAQQAQQAEAARLLLAATPQPEVLPALLEAGPAALPLLPHLAARCALLPDEWAQVPRPCPQLAPLLPMVLERSVEEAAGLVGCLGAAQRKRLRACALGLARAQRAMGVHLPAPVVWRILAHFGS